MGIIIIVVVVIIVFCPVQLFIKNGYLLFALAPARIFINLAFSKLCRFAADQWRYIACAAVLKAVLSRCTAINQIPRYLVDA